MTHMQIDPKAQRLIDLHLAERAVLDAAEAETMAEERDEELQGLPGYLPIALCSMVEASILGCVMSMKTNRRAAVSALRKLRRP